MFFYVTMRALTKISKKQILETNELVSSVFEKFIGSFWS
jgi:hypothetical protein